MLFNYLNTTCRHKKLIGIDNRGTPQYAPEQIIKCRKISYVKLIKTASGEEKSTTAKFYVIDNVRAGDMLDNMVVIESTPWVTFDCAIWSYKVIV